MARQELSTVLASLLLPWVAADSALGTGVFTLIADEVEPNDSLLAPQDFAPFPAGPVSIKGFLIIHGAIVPGDVDFFQVHFPQPLLTFSAIGGNLGDPPNLIGLYSSSGALLDSGDFLDGSLAPGTYLFAISGSTDLGFQGAHDEAFDYTFALSWISVPAAPSLVMMSLGLLGRSRRR